MFGRVISVFVQETLETIDLIFRDIVIEVGKSVVTLTPVKTGRLKGNWQLSVQAPVTHSLIRYDGVGDSTLSDLVNTAGTLTGGQVAYIVNNLTYAGFIEHGGSRFKAPEGMVGPTQTKFEIIIRDAISKYKM